MKRAVKSQYELFFNWLNEAYIAGMNDDLSSLCILQAKLETLFKNMKTINSYDAEYYKNILTNMK